MVTRDRDRADVLPAGGRQHVEAERRERARADQRPGGGSPERTSAGDEECDALAFGRRKEKEIQDFLSAIRTPDPGVPRVDVGPRTHPSDTAGYSWPLDSHNIPRSPHSLGLPGDPSVPPYTGLGPTSQFLDPILVAPSDTPTVGPMVDQLGALNLGATGGTPAYQQVLQTKIRSIVGEGVWRARNKEQDDAGGSPQDQVWRTPVPDPPPVAPRAFSYNSAASLHGTFDALAHRGASTLELGPPALNASSLPRCHTAAPYVRVHNDEVDYRVIGKCPDSVLGEVGAPYWRLSFTGNPELHSPSPSQQERERPQRIVDVENTMRRFSHWDDVRLPHNGPGRILFTCPTPEHRHGKNAAAPLPLEKRPGCPHFQILGDFSVPFFFPSMAGDMRPLRVSPSPDAQGGEYIYTPPTPEELADPDISPYRTSVEEGRACLQGMSFVFGSHTWKPFQTLPESALEWEYRAELGGWLRCLRPHDHRPEVFCPGCRHDSPYAAYDYQAIIQPTVKNLFGGHQDQPYTFAGAKCIHCKDDKRYALKFAYHTTLPWPIVELPSHRPVVPGHPTCGSIYVGWRVYAEPATLDDSWAQPADGLPGFPAKKKRQTGFPTVRGPPPPEWGEAFTNMSHTDKTLAPHLLGEYYAYFCALRWLPWQKAHLCAQFVRAPESSPFAREAESFLARAGYSWAAVLVMPPAGSGPTSLAKGPSVFGGLASSCPRGSALALGRAGACEAVKALLWSSEGAALVEEMARSTVNLRDQRAVTEWVARDKKLKREAQIMARDAKDLARESPWGPSHDSRLDAAKRESRSSSVPVSSYGQPPTSSGAPSSLPAGDPKGAPPHAPSSDAGKGHIPDGKPKGNGKGGPPDDGDPGGWHSEEEGARPGRHWFYTSGQIGYPREYVGLARRAQDPHFPWFDGYEAPYRENIWGDYGEYCAVQQRLEYGNEFVKETSYREDVRRRVISTALGSPHVPDACAHRDYLLGWDAWDVVQNGRACSPWSPPPLPTGDTEADVDYYWDPATYWGRTNRSLYAFNVAIRQTSHEVQHMSTALAESANIARVTSRAVMREVPALWSALSEVTRNLAQINDLLAVRTCQLVPPLSGSYGVEQAPDGAQHSRKSYLEEQRRAGYTSGNPAHLPPPDRPNPPRGFESARLRMVDHEPHVNSLLRVQSQLEQVTYTRTRDPGSTEPEETAPRDMELCAHCPERDAGSFPNRGVQLCFGCGASLCAACPRLGPPEYTGGRWCAMQCRRLRRQPVPPSPHVPADPPPPPSDAGAVEFWRQERAREDPSAADEYLRRPLFDGKGHHETHSVQQQVFKGSYPDASKKGFEKGHHKGSQPVDRPPEELEKGKRKAPDEWPPAGRPLWENKKGKGGKDWSLPDQLPQDPEKGKGKGWSPLDHPHQPPGKGYEKGWVPHQHPPQPVPPRDDRPPWDGVHQQAAYAPPHWSEPPEGHETYPRVPHPSEWDRWR